MANRFHTVANNVTDADADDINQFTTAFNGTPGEGKPLDLTQLDEDRYYVVVKNLNANSKLLQLLKSDGTVVLQANAGGVTLSPDGSPAGTPVTTGATQTLTNKTYVFKRATSTASAASLTLPTDGNVVPITGTATITGIATANMSGALVLLAFQSAGCTVQDGGGLRLRGNFTSREADDVLVLHCDGANWIEVARAGGSGGASGSHYDAVQVATASTSYVDSGSQVTVTTRGGDVIVMFSCSASTGNTGGQRGQFGLKVDAGANVDLTKAGPWASGEYDAVACVHRVVGLSAGSHTFKVRMKAITAGSFRAEDRSLVVWEV